MRPLIFNRHLPGMVFSALAAAIAAALLVNSTSAAATAGQSEDKPKAADNSLQLEEVVVTAQRREQKLQEVPIAISAISSDAFQAAGVTGTTSLQAMVPSLNIVRQANGASPFLRGIGASIGDANAEGSVAVYLDGVYQPSQFGNFFDLADIERVEVLKGPQGTLFGRNSTGGVIQVVTKDPGKDLQAKASVGYASYSTVTADGYVAVPVSDNVAFNTSVYYQNRSDGWGKNIFTGASTPGANTSAIRSKLKITPGANTTIVVAGNYSKYRDGALTGQPPRDVPHQTTISPYPGDYNVNANKTDGSHTESYGGSLHVDHDFASARLASITAYQKTTGIWDLDFDATPLQIVDATLSEKSKMFSQEVHLLSPAQSKLQWLLGAFYYYRDAGFFPSALRGLAFFPGTGVDINAGSTSRSRSFFAQATYPILPDTNLTGGFRYSWESSDGIGGTYLPGTNIIIDTANGKPATDKLSYSKPTWRISIDHKFSPDVLGYLSYNRGVKSGNFGLSAGAAGLSRPYLPEQLDAYEIGLKSEWLDHRVRINASVFDYDFKNYQFQKLVAGSAFVFNGNSANIYGGEIEIEARPTENLTLNANLGLLHSRVGDFPDAPNNCLAPNGASDGGGVCAPGTFAQLPGPTVPYNAHGTPLINAPPTSGNAGFVYNHPTAGGNIALSSNIYYFGGASASIGNRLRYRKYTALNASIGWTNAAKLLGVRIWGKNLTSQYYYTQLSAAAGLSDLAAPAEPRTFGVTVTYDFR